MTTEPARWAICDASGGVVALCGSLLGCYRKIAKATDGDLSAADIRALHRDDPDRILVIVGGVPEIYRIEKRNEVAEGSPPL